MPSLVSIFLVLSLAGFLHLFLSQFAPVWFQSSRSSTSNPPGRYLIGAATDNDHEARDEEHFVWRSKLQRVIALVSSDSEMHYQLELGRQLLYRTQHSKKNRSMELSALLMHENRLLAFGDYTGFIFELPHFLDDPTADVWAQPLIFLPSGNGDTEVAFKSEWVAKKDDTIVVGSIGKEWVVDRKIIHNMCEWVKSVRITFGKAQKASFALDHVDWTKRYRWLRKELGYEWPSYLLHEALIWDEDERLWVVAPRKASPVMYEEAVDQLQGWNRVIFVNEDWTEIVRLVEVGTQEAEWGFSAIKKLPGSPNHFVGVQAKEISKVVGTHLRDVSSSADLDDYSTGSRMLVFDGVSGKILSNVLYLGDDKYEGVEVLSQG